MNSYENSFWPSSSLFNQDSHSIQIYENYLQPQQQYFHQLYHDYQYNSTQNSLMNYSDYSTSNHYVSFDDHHYSVQYRPQYSPMYPYEHMINTNTVHVNQSFTPQSSIGVSESSSEIDIIDEESMETYSSDSERLIIRYHSPSSSPSSSACSRQVIIKSPDQTRIISNKSRRRRQGRRIRKKQRKIFFYEKELIYKKKSSLHFSKHKHHYSSFEQSEHKEDQLKRLYNEYSSEDIHREWKPLTHTESRELYQYAFDKYHKKSLFN